MFAKHYSSDLILHLERISERKPKDPVVVFFGRPNSFSDNSKYLFLDACANSYGFTPIWLTADGALFNLLHDAELPVLSYADQLVVVLRLLVKVAVVVYCVNPNEAILDARVRAALHGAFKLQLWHGLFANKLDMQLTDSAPLADPGSTYQLFGAAEVDAVLSPAERQDPFFYQAFGATSLLRCGYPRNEVILREPSREELLGAFDPGMIRTHAPGARILFCPTFSKVKAPAWKTDWLLDMLEKMFQDQGISTFIKPHPFEAALAPAFSTLREGVFLIPANDDIYPSLAAFDLMVSDYSSLLDDFHLTGKPMLMLDSPERTFLRGTALFADMHYDRLAGVVKAEAFAEVVSRAIAGAGDHVPAESEYSTEQLGSSSRLNTCIAALVAERCARTFEVLEI
jgi:CDP-glycerol glycerophosphotransferase (TagB/SpsB family)